MLHGGRVELTRDAVIAFGRQLRRDDEVVIEATVNTARIVRLLAPFVRRGPCCIEAVGSTNGSSTCISHETRT
jgi:hypothetical protein